MTDSRTALVTGAASGIGRATCERLAKNGWRVLAVDCNAEKLKWTEGCAGVIGTLADVASEADNARVVAEAERATGRLDAIVLNAAMPVHGLIDQLPWEEFQRAMAVNMFGPVLGVRAGLPALRRAGGGAIVITSSTMGLAGDEGMFAYVMAKHALLGLVRTLSREVGWEGIRVNAVCPGSTKTGMSDLIKDKAAHDALMKRQVPLGRAAVPDEIASVIEFLISPAASYVNGHALVADGGAMVGIGIMPPASEVSRGIAVTPAR